MFEVVLSVEQIFSFPKMFSCSLLFTCFECLVSTAKNVKRNGEIFDKIKLALIYSSQTVAADVDFLHLTAIKKRLSNLLLFSATSTYKQTSSTNQNVDQKLLQLGDRNELIIQLHQLHH